MHRWGATRASELRADRGPEVANECLPFSSPLLRPEASPPKKASRQFTRGENALARIRTPLNQAEQRCTASSFSQLRSRRSQAWRLLKSGVRNLHGPFRAPRTVSGEPCDCLHRTRVLIKLEL